MTELNRTRPAAKLRAKAPAGTALAKALQVLLCGCGLVASVAASATSLNAQWTYELRLRAVAAQPSNFGVLAELAGSCWKVEGQPAVEACYGFDSTGRSLNARVSHGGRVQAESSLTASGRPGWLLETSRWAASADTTRNHLRVDAVSGQVFREPVLPAHYDHRDYRSAYERPQTMWFSETVRRLDADRFEWVQRSGRADGYGSPRSHEWKVSSWVFTRSRSCAEHFSSVM